MARPDCGMYLYPWDIGKTVRDFFVDYERFGCNSVAPALAYHQGSVVSARRGKILGIKKSALSFNPTPGLYGRLKPDVHKKTADAGVVAAMREWCLETGKTFSGWTVLLHNSTLGERHPDACTVNFAGDVLTFSLCPGNRDVVEYAVALIENICTTLKPDSLMLESATPRAAIHGDHHEISNIKITPALVWLMSLCFCPSCMDTIGNRSRIDPVKVKETCSAVVGRLLNSETFYPGNELAQIATLLLEYPELHFYQVERQKIAAELVEKISAVMRKHSVSLRIIPSSFPHPIMSSFLESSGFRELGNAADAFVPLVYGAGETYRLVRNNIRLLGVDKPVGMAMTLNPNRFSAKEDFLNAVGMAVADNPYCSYFYNYSIASEERLGWLREAVSLLS